MTTSDSNGVNTSTSRRRFLVGAGATGVAALVPDKIANAAANGTGAIVQQTPESEPIPIQGVMVDGQVAIMSFAPSNGDEVFKKISFDLYLLAQQGNNRDPLKYKFELKDQDGNTSYILIVKPGFDHISSISLFDVRNMSYPEEDYENAPREDIIESDGHGGEFLALGEEFSLDLSYENGQYRLNIDWLERGEDDRTESTPKHRHKNLDIAHIGSVDLVQEFGEIQRTFSPERSWAQQLNSGISNLRVLVKYVETGNVIQSGENRGSIGTRSSHDFMGSVSQSYGYTISDMDPSLHSFDNQSRTILLSSPDSSQVYIYRELDTLLELLERADGIPSDIYVSPNSGDEINPDITLDQTTSRTTIFSANIGCVIQLNTGDFSGAKVLADTLAIVRHPGGRHQLTWVQPNLYAVAGCDLQAASALVTAVNNDIEEFFSYENDIKVTPINLTQMFRDPSVISIRLLQEQADGLYMDQFITGPQLMAGNITLFSGFDLSLPISARVEEHTGLGESIGYQNNIATVSELPRRAEIYPAYAIATLVPETCVEVEPSPVSHPSADLDRSFVRPL